MKSRRAIQFGMLAMVALVVAPLGLVAGAFAQGGGGAQMSVQAPTADAQIKEGGPDIQVEVQASGVTNLAAFQFSLQYDPKILKYKGVKEKSFLGSSGRSVQCPDPLDQHEGKTAQVRFNCVTLGAPVSLGGAKGADGSGTLAEISFAPVGGGTSPLELSDTIFVAAEIDSGGMPVEIQSSAQGSSLDVIGTSGGFPFMIVGGVIGAVIVVVVVGGGALVLSRRMRAAQ